MSKKRMKKHREKERESNDVNIEQGTAFWWVALEWKLSAVPKNTSDTLHNNKYASSVFVALIKMNGLCVVLKCIKIQMRTKMFLFIYNTYTKNEMWYSYRKWGACGYINWLKIGRMRWKWWNESSASTLFWLLNIFSFPTPSLSLYFFFSTAHVWVVGDIYAVLYALRRV